jgi:uncharacterized protein (TIGR01777 family)
MDVAITGASGLIGTALVGLLRAEGHRPIRLVRRAASGADEITWDPAGGTIDAASLEGVGAVVHLAGAGIGDKRWSDAYKREILESRTLGTGLLARTLAGLDRRPAAFLSGSAIGFYGAHGDEEFDETSPAGSGFLADVVQAWEGAAAPAAEAGIRTAFLRTGIVLSPAGGALKKQLPIFKSGLGGRFGSGRAWQSWISIDDEVGAIVFLLDATVAGPVNLTAPNPVTNAEFTKVLGTVLRRPTAMPIPSFGPKLLLGREAADALLFTGQRVLPRVLESAGYRFADPQLEGALRRLLDKPAA